MKRNIGFSIVEILLVLILLAIAVVPIMFLVWKMIDTTTRAKHLTTAAFLAERKMEEIRYLSLCTSCLAGRCLSTGKNVIKETPNCNNFVTGFCVDYDSTPPASTCSFSVPFDNYKCKIVDNMMPGIANWIKEIQISIWYDYDSDNNYDKQTSGDVITEDGVTLETRITYRNYDYTKNPYQGENCP